MTIFHNWTCFVIMYPYLHYFWLHIQKASISNYRCHAIKYSCPKKLVFGHYFTIQITVLGSLFALALWPFFVRLLSTIVPGGSFLQSTLPKIFSPFTFSHKHDFHFNLSLFCYSFWIKTLEMWDSFSKWNKIRSSVRNENNQILFN